MENKEKESQKHIEKPFKKYPKILFELFCPLQKLYSYSKILFSYSAIKRVKKKSCKDKRFLSILFTVKR